MSFCCFGSRRKDSPQEKYLEIDGEVHKVKLFSYKELIRATDNFSSANKIGEGGFGSVYKGNFRDGTVAAIKVLSAESKQGLREFLTEIVVISDVCHDNLVKLHGCCVEGEHRILLYEYLENNSLSQTLLGAGFSGISFSWEARKKICTGIARGLAYLHEECKHHIIHRDIKASNILLDKDLNAKISDFGLAKLLPPNITHASTRVAGTIGYLAPEYAIRGQVTPKSDVYSFGVLLLEIVCGRCNTNMKLPIADRFLLERVWLLYERNKLIEIVDSSLNGDFNDEEAIKYLKIGLICTQNSLKLRPSMSTVVRLLNWERDVGMVKITKPGLMSDFMDYQSKDSTGTGTGAMTSTNTGTTSPYDSSADGSYPTFPFTAITERD